MEVRIIKDEKNEMEISIDSLTVAEALRIYLQKEDSVSFAAWRQEHPSKPVLLRVETKGKSPRKAIEDAIEHIQKDADKLVEQVKKS